MKPFLSAIRLATRALVGAAAGTVALADGCSTHAHASRYPERRKSRHVQNLRLPRHSARSAAVAVLRARGLSILPRLDPVNERGRVWAFA
jgi:hypothetical protein